MTLTFTGVNSTILVGAEPVPTVIGHIQVVATGSGFVFPAGSNPAVPAVFFNLSVTQSSPTAGTAGRIFSAFGGGMSLNFSTLVSNWVQFPTGPNPPPFTYTNIVYTLHPFTIPNTNAVVDVTAGVSAIPEPTSLLLLGSAIGMMVPLLKKRSSN